MERNLTPTSYELIPLDSKTNVRFFTSIDPGSYVAPHWHDALEIIYLLEGNLKVIVDGVDYDLKKGQCFMVSICQIHSTFCTSPNHAIVFQIPENFIKKFIPDSKNLQFTLQDPSENAIFQSKVDSFKETLLKMKFLVDLQPDGAILRFNSLLFEVLFQLYHNFCIHSEPEKNARHNRNLNKLKPILDYIDTNYNHPISLQEISEVAILQPKYFCRFFKKYMGITFLEYQNELRLSKIYKDITTTNDKISDILERHGFTNYKLFRRMFRERFHSTPTELRKNQTIQN